MAHTLPPHQASSGTMYKLTILGDGGVGKTALVIQLCLNRFVETYDATIEDSYRKRILLDGQITTLEIMDTAGQEDYAALRDQWIRDGEGFLMVYSVTDRGSFERTKDYYSQLLRVKDGESFGLVLLGNKCDEEDERAVGLAEGERLAQSWGVPFFETSAKFDLNIDFAFLQAARLTRNTHYEDSPPSSRASFDRGDQQQQRQSSYSSTQSDPLAVDGAGRLTSALPQLGQKPPLITQRSAETQHSASSWVSPRGSFEAAQRYARSPSAVVPSAAAPNAAPNAATSVLHAPSVADSDGGETIVARPRQKKKKAKCSIM